MRRNLPVTNVEYILKDHETIVSKTDLKGKITYVNQDFIRISGFSAEELLGAPQNIVRHPDMPSEAFADFWRTIKAGKAWTGMVKNRCKNGDHYWVEANAAPLYEKGKLVGYTSIRVKPGRDKVAAAEQVYREISSGSSRLEIREGVAVPRSMARGRKLLSKLSLRARITLSCAALSTLFLATLSGSAAWRIVPATLGIVVAVLSGYLLHRAAVAPLARLRADIDTMSAGDLSAHIEAPGNDEITDLSQALRVLQTNVKVLVGQIKEATEVVGHGTAEMAAGNAELSARTEAQASALEETAASMEELTGTVRNNVDNAQEANRLVGNATETAQQGGHAVGEVVATMGLISESSRQIADIIGVINGIAFQTNILALNASVEAARAGEQGRGFAVVASEVRSLAERSASAARQIEQLIKDSVERVGVGVQLADQAGKTMADIVQHVRQAAGFMADITAASREQSAGIEQVNQAIVEMDRSTQQTAAMVEEAAAASAEMRDQADKLEQLVNGFKLVGGRVAPPAQPVARAPGRPALAAHAR